MVYSLFSDFFIVEGYMNSLLGIEMEFKWKIKNKQNKLYKSGGAECLLC